MKKSLNPTSFPHKADQNRSAINGSAVTGPIVTLIRHHHNTAELRDNAVVHLEERGFDVQHRYPFDGDPLIIPDSGVTPTIVLGGGQNVTELSTHDYLKDELRWIEACLANDMPVLGICLGAQLLAHALGAQISSRDPAECEYGFYTIYPTANADHWLAEPTLFMQAHYQEFALPDGAVRLAYSDRYPQQAFRYGTNACAIQFHPEVNASIFQHWIADSWSDEMASTRGAQEKSLQSEMADVSLKGQRKWFVQTLDQMFKL